MTTHDTAAGIDVSGRVSASGLTEPHREITPDVPALILSAEPEMPEASVETELLDLSEVSLSTLRLIDHAILSSSVRRIMTQVDRPRANIGTEPPKRVD